MREWLFNDHRDKASQVIHDSGWVLAIGEPVSMPGMLPLDRLKEIGFVGFYKVGERDRTARQRPQ